MRGVFSARCFIDLSIKGVAMTSSLTKRTAEQMVEAVFALDLEPIKHKLMDKREGYGWSRTKAEHLELQYRRFLALLAKYPDEVIAPSSDVDKFWHGHILDTMKYARDCDAVFGYFLHHYPYFGMRGEEDAANLARAAQNMRRLYQQEFGAVQAVSAKDEETAYCARSPELATADNAYCARLSGHVLAGVAYCAREAAQESADTAYCARVDSSYCARACEQEVCAAPDETSAYCAASTRQLFPIT
jgi:hypothetical protein